MRRMWSGIETKRKKIMIEKLGKEFQVAVDTCSVRSAIYRLACPQIKYWKNNPLSIKERVPIADQLCNDWVEHDPREQDYCSLFMYND